MKIKSWLPLLALCFCACQHVSSNDKMLSLTEKRERAVFQQIDSLKRLAHEGDLLVRLTDDFVSAQVRLINEKEKLYSHAGLLFKNTNDDWVVYNISPDENGGDTLKYTPLNTFIDPSKNISCALYRYNLQPGEAGKLKNTLDLYKNNGLVFDWDYDLQTNQKMYCAEMIASALYKSTSQRIVIDTGIIPKNMLKNVRMFFKDANLTEEEIAQRKIIAIDHLYLRPDCKKITAFTLKYFPGE